MTTQRDNKKKPLKESVLDQPRTSNDHKRALTIWQPGSTEYEEAEEELIDMKTSNPHLYAKIINWD